MPHDTRLLERLDRFDGEVIGPGDPAYDGARRVWNAVFDLRPAVIVRPRSAAAVADAIRVARDQDLELAVRSGGHSPSGHSTCDGGLVLDLAGLRGVRVEPTTRTARANGGALLGELDVAAQAHGLVCPTGVVGHTGLAGLTLGGGVGRLQRAFGLTVDNVRAVELVTADGRVVRASETEEPELFWGIRGAGWNFGVVTAFELGLHPFGPDLHRGVRIYRAADAHEVWEVFRDFAVTAPDAVSMIFGLYPAGAHDADPTTTRADGDPTVVVSFNHRGPAGLVERDTAGLRLGPEPSSVSGGPQRYLEVQTAHDLVLGWGGRSHIAGRYADDIRADALDALIDHVAAGPAGGSFSITAQGGAIARVDDGAMAYAGRVGRFALSADASWTDPEDDEVNQAWVRRAIAFAEVDAIEGRYANENADVGPAETRAIYGEAKTRRLAQLKRAWDPDNVFRRNHNVLPTD
jgi:FAD/FMN-containing dehydrogenase